MTFQLSSPQKVVDVSCRDNHFCLGYESEREDLMDSIDFSLLSLPPRATFTVSPEDDDDDEDDEDLFADDRRGMDLLEMRACESDGLLDLDDDEEVYTAASIPATAASAVKPSTKRTNTKSRSKTLSTAPTFPTSPLTQSIAAAPLPPPLPETCPVRYSHRQTIYEEFTAKGIDWCRYCGVTKGGQTAAFRPGPWGRRTLCNKHGCDYKGYGYADKQSRLDLSKFRKESVQDRIRPVLQDFCIVCFQRTSPNGSVLVQCDGCPRGHHVECHGGIPHRIWSAALTSSNKTSDSDDPEEEDSTHSHHQQPWYCSDTCSTSRKTTRINLELPKKNLPFMNCSGISNQHRRTSSSGSSTSSLSPTPDSDPCSSPPLLADDWAKLERRDSGLDLAMPHHASSRRRDSVAVGTRSRYQPYDTRTRRQSHAH
ncbi:hypothetical protein DFS34DRAFT_317923 [Phlyctochytrium arcticum]|nr:hypothetical protein DFS34DRAFT_317923 [Phlyctochytrium arcticum]